MSSHADDDHAKARLRHFRYLGMQSWRVSTVVWTLPFVLHISLVLFFAGLVLFASLSDWRVAIMSGCLVAVTLTFYVVTLALPLFFVQCPFRTPPIQPLQNFLLRLNRWTLEAILLVTRRSPGLSRMRRDVEENIALRGEQSSEGKEVWAIDGIKDVLDADILASLMSTTWNKLDKVITEAISDLRPGGKARDILRAADAGRLIEKRYLGLLRLNNEYPHLTIAPGKEGEAYTYLKALLHLHESEAIPPDWQPSNRLRHSLHWCKQAEDKNMKLTALELIDRLNVRRDDFHE